MDYKQTQFYVNVWMLSGDPDSVNEKVCPAVQVIPREVERAYHNKRDL